MWQSKEWLAATSKIDGWSQGRSILVVGFGCCVPTSLAQPPAGQTGLWQRCMRFGWGVSREIQKPESWWRWSGFFNDVPQPGRNMRVSIRIDCNLRYPVRWTWRTFRDSQMNPTMRLMGSWQLDMCIVEQDTLLGSYPAASEPWSLSLGLAFPDRA
jgi:hypothetical protein